MTLNANRLCPNAIQLDKAPAGFLYGLPVYFSRILPREWPDHYGGMMVQQTTGGWLTHPENLDSPDTYDCRLRSHPEWRELNNQ